MVGRYDQVDSLEPVSTRNTAPPPCEPISAWEVVRRMHRVGMSFSAPSIWPDEEWCDAPTPRQEGYTKPLMRASLTASSEEMEMGLSRREVAEAFSGHQFEDAFTYLTEDVVWRMPGADGIRGREAVVAACRNTAAALTDTEIGVARFFVVDGGDSVAVDTLMTYRNSDGASTVASCDLYEFRDELIVQITSYTVEVQPPGVVDR